MYLMPTLIVPLQVRAFLLAAGFSLAFGAMFTKTYRVHQIFTRAHSGLVKSKVSNLGLQQFSQSKFYEMLSQRKSLVLKDNVILVVYTFWLYHICTESRWFTLYLW